MGHCCVTEGAERAAAVNAMLEAECHGSSSQLYWHHKSLWTRFIIMMLEISAYKEVYESNIRH